MSEPEQEVINTVSSIFEVKSINQNLDALQFEIEQEGFKQKFVELARVLESKNLVARLERFEGRIILSWQISSSKANLDPKSAFRCNNIHGDDCWECREKVNA